MSLSFSAYVPGIGDDKATFPGGKDLGLAKAEHSRISKSPYFLAVPLCPEGLSGIFNKKQIMFLGNLL